MGKDNDTPEAPDYGPLAEASETSAKYSYELAKRQQDWAEKVYAENKGVSDLVVDKALGWLDTQTEWALADRKRYEEIFQPLEEQLAYEAENYASPERLEYEAGKAEADVAAQFEQARRTAQERLETYGVDPSQTRAGAMDLGTRVAEAAAQASAGNQARDRAQEIQRQLRSEAINVGRGISSEANAEAGSSTQQGQAAANTGLATTASGSQTMGTGQTWQGQGNSALAGWGNIINQGYANEMAEWEANQQSDSGWGSAIGTLAGAFLGGPGGAALGGGFTKAMGWAEGGVIPDEEGYLDEEMSPSGGAVIDDIPAEITDTGQPARLSAGEFVIPEDVVSWLGEKGIQQLIMKARKEMTGGNGERPAQPTEKPPPYAGAGIPEPMGAI